MSEPSPHSLDKQQARKSFARAARSYDDAAFVQGEISRRMLDRLDYVRIQPQRILDIGCGTGMPTEALLKRYPKADVFALDFALPMLERARRRGRWLRRPRCLCADLDALPIAEQSIDLIFASASLQWSERPAEMFVDVARVLRPGGLLMFSSFGPDTLQELRAAWAEVDGRPHVHGFIDMHDYGDMLLAAGLVDPVMDVERLTLTYQDALQAMREIKAIGAANANAERARGLLGRDRMQRVCAAYERFRGADGRLPVSYEVVHGHAWGPLQRRVSGETHVSLNVLRQHR